MRRKKESSKTKISDNEKAIKAHEALIQKYEQQQMDVRNNREYEAIAREVESEQLDIELKHKEIRNLRYQVGQKDMDIAGTQERLTGREEDLETKRKELEVISKESEEKEQELHAKREKEFEKLEERLQRAYSRLRGNMRNGLAVVKVERNACGGCFSTVPPQRQVDIRERKKLVICENCGRVLADVIEYIEPEKKRKTTRRKKKRRKFR